MHLVRPVIIRLPEELPGPVELCVHHYEWGVEVDARPLGSSAAWTPIQLLGGTLELRDA